MGPASILQFGSSLPLKCLSGPDECIYSTGPPPTVCPDLWSPILLCAQPPPGSDALCPPGLRSGLESRTSRRCRRDTETAHKPAGARGHCWNHQQKDHQPRIYPDKSPTSSFKPTCPGLGLDFECQQHHDSPAVVAASIKPLTQLHKLPSPQEDEGYRPTREAAVSFLRVLPGRELCSQAGLSCRPGQE